jgi:hypothetical protein
MPRVVYSDSKGLVQETGSGFSFVAGTVSEHSGLHLYQEEVTLTPNADGFVAGVLSKALPENAIIHKLAVTTSVAAGGGDVALFAWNHPDAANLNDGDFAWQGVEEILGINSTGEFPAGSDLDYSTDGKTIINQTAQEVGIDAQSTATITIENAVIVAGTTEIELIDLIGNDITFGFDEDIEVAAADDTLIYFEDGVDTAATLAVKIAEKINNHPDLEITAVVDDTDILLTQDRAGIEGDTNITINTDDEEISGDAAFTGGANAKKWLYLINQGDNSGDAEEVVKVVVSVMYSGKGLVE